MISHYLIPARHTLKNSAAMSWMSVCKTGAGCSYKHGIKVNLWSTDAVAGAGGKDTAYSTSSNATTGATVGWDVCYAIGDSYGQWPVKTTGALIGTVATGSGTSPPYACAWGIDFGAVAFSGGLIRRAGVQCQR